MHAGTQHSASRAIALFFRAIARHAPDNHRVEAEDPSHFGGQRVRVRAVASRVALFLQRFLERRTVNHGVFSTLNELLDQLHRHAFADVSSIRAKQP